MKGYHLTQEQVRDIGERLRIKGELTTTNLVNAVLDQVLGEPVAEVEVRKNRILTDTLMQATTPISDGRHKLYAPKEQS
jgi:5-hydroxyisourate hydrolase-like protein (transthyretin family)